ncbi:MAG: PKD domain-containing protein [Flavobacteriales bacterium]|nr:PKD domain-containing protein [Flavobacteriales bacterium]
MHNSNTFLAACLLSVAYPSTSSAQWQVLPTVPPLDIRGMQALTDQALLAGAEDAVLRSTNGGDSWTSLPITLFGQSYPGPVFDLHFKDALEGYAVGLHSLGDETVILRTTDGGTTWQVGFSDLSGQWPRFTYGIDFASASVGVTVGSSGKIQRTIDGGNSWYVESSVTSSTLYDVQFSSATNGVAVGANVILRTTNGGDVWTFQSVAGTLRGVSFSSATNGFAIGSANLLYQTTNGGSTWQQVVPLLLETVDFTSIHAASSTVLHATSNQRIWRSTDGGLHWEWYACNGVMNDILFTPGGTGYASGNDGELRRTGPVDGPYTPSPYFTLEPVVACADSVLYCTNGTAGAQAFTWLINGVPFSAQTDASIVLNAPAQTDTIGLVAMNGALADTAYRSVNVAPTLVLGGEVSLISDTLCSGQSTSVRVTGSQSGTSYRLYRGGVPVGNAQNGNGGVLNFGTGVITANDTVVLVADRTVIGCGSTSTSDTLTILMATPSAAFALAPLESALCYGDSTVIVLPVSALNTSYRLYKGNTAFGLAVNGTGGALNLPTGPLTTTTTFSVRATHVSGCMATATATATIQVQDPRAYFNLSAINPVAGVAVDALNTTDVPGGTYLWQFGAGAMPQTSTATSPTGIVFGSGVHDVQLTVTSPAGCQHTRTVRVHGIAPLSASGCLAVQGVLDNVNMNLPTVNINPTTQEVYAIVHATDARKALFTSGRGDTLELEMPLIDYPNSISELGESELFVKFSPELVPLWGVPLHHNSWLSGGGDIAFAADGSVYLAFGHSHYLDSLRIHSSDGSFVTIDPSVGSAQYPLMLIKYDPSGRHLWHVSLQGLTGKYVLKVAANGDLILSDEGRVRRLNSLGEELWVNGVTFTRDVELVPNGDIWAIGIQASTVPPLVRIGPDGTEQFVSPLIEQLPGPTGQIQFGDIRIDGDGLLASGFFKGRWVFGPDTLEYYPPAGLNYNASFLTRFNLQGIPQWAHRTEPSSVITHKGADLVEGRYYAMFRALGVVALEDGTSIDQGIDGYHLFSADADGSDPALDVVYSAPSFLTGLGTMETDIRYDPGSEELCMMMTVSDEGPFQVGDLALIPATPFERNNNLAIVKGPIGCFTSGTPTTPYSYFQTPTGTCANAPFILQDASSQEPTTWAWSMPGAVPDVSTEEAPEISYALPGTYTVTLTASNANGTGTTYTSDLVIDVCTAISNGTTAGMLLSPVPADEGLWIDASSFAGAAYHVVDMTGRHLLQGILLHRTYLTTAALPTGCYMVVMDGPSGRHSMRFLVAH